MGSTVSLTLARYFDKERELRIQLREKRVPEYEKFAQFWFDMLFAEKLGKKPMTSEKIMKGFVEWTQPLMIWGSDDVIRKWGLARVSFSEGEGTERFESMFKFEELLLQLRRDAGYHDTNLQKGDLLRLFINDINKYL